MGLSREALGRQLSVPGCVGFTALAEDGPVAMAVVFISGHHAHLHAMVSSSQGEAPRARFALIQAAVELTAAAGTTGSATFPAYRDPAARLES